MLEGAAARVLYEHSPKIKQAERPSLDFFTRLHDTFGIELDSLRGLNAMTRPFEEQQRTIAEVFYNLDSPAEVMEVNRTTMNVWLYDLIQGDQSLEQLQKSYNAFTDNQRPGSKLTFEDFLELKNIVDTAIPPENHELFRAMLIYSDLGKSTRMQQYARQHFGREYSDHDALLVDILNDPAATAYCMPSFLTFSPKDQATMKACFNSGFHLGQYQKLETLPYHLMGIQELPPQLRDMVLLTGLFDIAGANGDKTQNGTPALNNPTFTAFKQARKSVHLNVTAASPQEHALSSYNSYLGERNQDYGFNIQTPEGYALARFVSMVRILKPDEIAAVESIFNDHVGATSKAIFTDLLTQTGFEKNSMWIEYGPALARNVFTAMKQSGCSLEQALSSSMTTLARVTNAARPVIRKTATHTSEPATIMASTVAHQAKKHWPHLMKQAIAVTHTAGSNSEYTATLAPVPRVELTEQNQLQNLNHLKNEGGLTLTIGVGGGSDCLFARYAAESLIGIPNAPVVSFPGFSEDSIRSATKVAPNVYLATTATYFENKRSFEYAAAETGPCYIIAGVEKGNTTKLHAAFFEIAEHIQKATGHPISQILTVDSGGDIYETPSAHWNRDHASLKAAHALEQRFNIHSSQSIILTPKEPQNINQIAQATSTSVYRMSPPDMAAFRRLLERHHLPSDDTRLYSQMLSLAHYALKPHGLHGVEPLHLPVEQAVKNGRPAYGVTAASMQDVLVVSNDRLRAYHKTL